MRKLKATRFNTKLIVDVIGATLIVQTAPKLLSSVISLDPMLQTVAGVGAGYLAGTFFKRPDLANASIGVGVVSFLTPVVNNLIGGGSEIPPGQGTIPIKAMPPSKLNTVSAYLNLNDYLSLQDSQTNEVYRSSY